MTGMEPWAISVVSGVAVPIFQILCGSGGKILGMFGKSLDENTREIIFAASKQYVQNYEERHGILKVLGMRDPVRLESIYTAVQFLDNDAIRNFESIENLEEVYRQAKSRGFQSHDGKKQAGIKVANDKQYLMVLGGPGAGKSTFVRKIGLEALKGKKGGFKHACIPVFIELKRFASGNIDIKAFIAEEFRICGFPSPDKFTVKALEEGKLLILLDGLDEVPTKNLTEAISEIQNFVDKYDKNRFISSCRTAAYRSSFRRFSDVGMADFDDDQIQQFIDNWFHCEADKQAKTGEKCWELLQKPEHEAAKELAHTPLLLTFICLVYDRSQNFPDNRSVLYRKALRILLEEWASEKRILRDEIYQGLHTELEELLLSEIAYTGFESDRLFFSQRDIVGQIKTFLASNLNAPQHLDGESVLNAIAIQQGILVERAEDVFSFSHLTLQEYLTAQYIDDHRQIEKLVTEHLTDKRWKEVFLLVAGLMRGGADGLLLLMEKEAQKYINTPKSQALLNWAEQVTVGSSGDFKPVGKRAVAIAMGDIIAYANAIIYDYPIPNSNAMAYANGIAIDNAIAIDNVFAYAIAIVEATNGTIGDAIQYTYNLEKLKIFNNIKFTVLIAQMEVLKAKAPDEHKSQEVLGGFAKHLQQALLNAFNLTTKMIDLSEEEAKALGDYLYANHLIIQCKQAAVRVSPQTWEAIEARMLLVL
ncbi:histidine kinase [Nostoc sp. 'Peltigera membranacea cyanobiont' 213]|uniref:NACHT domain-containing protein n=1 Tax=Nostoc sp. 'Peltigera membranacea cyanobiont' 213 TaxID=2014530 RepID=UPI000B95B468|nr:NACHT domain-containing protein [Nostoc sp. 'Peltigera membranacea cyanobiont' 213]OYD99359.1 histidine kinase [Nostoc sp. 'Peltigera membranacea cyanobiont' 213]